MGIFNNNRIPMQQTQNQPRPMNGGSGCKIRVRRDSQGRISSVESNGRCSRTELEIFKENMGIMEEEDEE